MLVNKQRIVIGDKVHIEFTVISIRNGDLFLLRNSKSGGHVPHAISANHNAIKRHVHKGQAH